MMLALFDALMAFAARREVAALAGGLFILMAFSWLLLLGYAHGRATMSTLLLLVGVPLLAGALLLAVAYCLATGLCQRP